VIDVGALLTLRPVALDADGAGLATSDDLQIHVAGALPGETVSARLVHVSPHRREAWASLDSVLSAAPERVPPLCPAYGACGGCVLQHLSPAGQLAWKRELVVTALAGLPGLPPVAPCVASPLSQGYRNQTKYVVAASGAPARLILGAYAPRSHRVVDLAGCRLGEPPLDEVAARLRDLLAREGVSAYDEGKRIGLLRHVVLRSNDRGQVLVTLVTAQAEFPAGARIASALQAACPAVVGVVQNVNDSPGNVIFGRDERTLMGTGVLRERFGAVEVELGPRAFAQLNRGVAQLAYAAIGRAIGSIFAGRTRARRLLDLYAGVGAIAFSLADAADEIVAVEENAGATQAGAQAAERAGLGHVRFVTGPVAAALAAVSQADVIVLNPPRAGAGAAVCANIARLQPFVLMYLSCNPTTLARDLASLTSADPDLVIDGVQPFDMLPHTGHVETLVTLRRVLR
jgi:23S rRNA (uracil1939-C5)-methyltransferase